MERGIQLADGSGQCCVSGAVQGHAVAIHSTPPPAGWLGQGGCSVLQVHRRDAHTDSARGSLYPWPWTAMHVTAPPGADGWTHVPQCHVAVHIHVQTCRQRCPHRIISLHVLICVGAATAMQTQGCRHTHPTNTALCRLHRLAVKSNSSLV